MKAFPFTRFPGNFYKAQIHGTDVLLIVSGVGLEPARRAAERLCREGAKVLVSAGFCGALDPELRIGDLLTDRIVSAKSPVRTLSERQAIAEKANARAVDMETQAVVEAGTRAGVPIRVLRVVSDLWEDDLTPLFGKDTTFLPLRIALRLFRPAVWPLALRLRRNSTVAKSRLLAAIDAFLQ